MQCEARNATADGQAPSELTCGDMVCAGQTSRHYVSVRRPHLESDGALRERQQRIDVAVFGGGQAGERAGEPGMGFEAVGLGGGEQAHDGSGALTSRFGTGEVPVLAADGDGPDGVLDGVVVDGVAAIGEDARERAPAFERVAHGTSQAAVAEHWGAELVQPAFELVEFGGEVSLSLAMPRRGVAVAQLRFDGVELADATHG